MFKILLFVMLSASMHAQSVSDVMSLINLIKNPPVGSVSIVASQGDGSALTFGKIPGPAILLAVSGTGVQLHTVTGDAIGSGFPVGVGDVLCLLKANTTPTALPAAGAWPAIPASSVGYQCTTQIRIAGAVAGQTPIVNGSFSWP